jgi:hypothetical protein
VVNACLRASKCYGLNLYPSLCSIFPYLHMHFPYLLVIFNPYILWHLLVLQACLAVCLVGSHMHYDIIEGFVSSCVAVHVMKVVGCSRLIS